MRHTRNSIARMRRALDLLVEDWANGGAPTGLGDPWPISPAVATEIAEVAKMLFGPRHRRVLLGDNEPRSKWEWLLVHVDQDLSAGTCTVSPRNIQRAVELLADP